MSKLKDSKWFQERKHNAEIRKEEKATNAKMDVKLKDVEVTELPLAFFIISGLTIVAAIFTTVFGFFDQPIYTTFRLGTPTFITSMVFGVFTLAGLAAQLYFLIVSKMKFTYHLVAIIIAAPMIFLNILGFIAIPMLVLSFILLKRKSLKKIWIPVFTGLAIFAAPIMAVVTLMSWALATSLDKDDTTSYNIQNGDILKDGSKPKAIPTGIDLSALTWNIGYAGTGSEMDYFYDKNFNGVTGSKGKAWSKSQVEEHLKGINMFLKASATKGGTIKVLNEASSGLNDKNIADDSKLTNHTFAKPVDFMMLQEVDRPSVRSLYVDEPSVIAKGLPKYDAQFVNNFKVGILPVPVMDPMGQVDGGLMTLSKYKINNAKRISLKSTDTGLVSIFDLKRAIGYTEYNVSDGKKLHMANIHMSAFSGDAVKRAKEYQTLLKLITTWKVGGDYVIIGGDWNSDITDQYYYSETKDAKAPNFLANAKKHKNENFLIDKSTSTMGTIDSTTKINYSALSIYDIAKYTQSFRDGMGSNPGYKLGADTNLKHPTMRMAGENWKGFQAKTYNKSDYAIIDGFLVSGNVEISTTIPVKTLQQGWHKNKLNPDFPYAFADSDHNPVVMHFQLKTTP